MNLRNKYITLKLFIILVFMTGIIYPLFLSFIGQIFFSYEANGSLYQNQNNIIGSSLIGQNFISDKYFHQRPSSYTPTSYGASDNGASSYSLTNRKFKELTIAKYNKLAENNKYLDIAPDEIFSSASGLDPYISLYNAYSQLDRIAKIRDIKQSQLQDIINKHVEKTFFNIIGNSRINVLILNNYLDNELNNHGKMGSGD